MVQPPFPFRRGRLRNQSELEVNAQHYKMQNVYKSQRARKGKKLLTDIDFEGILRIIGGCSTWQVRGDTHKL